MFDIPFDQNDPGIEMHRASDVHISRVPIRKKYWYHTTIYECPVCGKSETIRERRFTPKPKVHTNRYKYVTSYDWCDV